MKQKPTFNLSALIYADIFDYPLTDNELEKYAISDPACPPKHERRRESIKINKLLTKTEVYFHLPGRENLVALRKKRMIISQIKLDKAKAVAQKLSFIPTILGIFVTGNLAMQNADTYDDIDFLVITRVNTLWTTRLLVTLALELFGIRRRPKQKHTADRICVNMYLAESALTVPQNSRNLYTAHEVVQVLPLINKNHIYDRFLAANSWVNHFLPNFPIPPASAIPTHHYSPFTIHPVETLAYKLQRLYMKHKITRETITPHAALFHPRDTGSHILKKYHQKMNLFIDHES